MADLTLKKIKDILGNTLDQKLAPIKKKQEEHSQRLDSLVSDMIDVQKKTDVLSDLKSYIEDTSDQVKNHEERIRRLETSA